MAKIKKKLPTPHQTVSRAYIKFCFAYFIKILTECQGGYVYEIINKDG